jgi:hypothetical protein
VNFDSKELPEKPPKPLVFKRETRLRKKTGYVRKPAPGDVTFSSSSSLKASADKLKREAEEANLHWPAEVPLHPAPQNLRALSWMSFNCRRRGETISTVPVLTADEQIGRIPAAKRLLVLAEKIGEALEECGIPCRDAKTGRGLIDSFFVRLGFRGAVLITLRTGQGPIEESRMLSYILQEDIHGLAGVVRFNLEQKFKQIIFGQDFVLEKICGVSLQLGYNSACCRCPPLDELLAETAVDWLQKRRAKVVAVYPAGAGEIALPLAVRVNRVLAFTDAGEEENLRSAISLNGLQNCTLELGRPAQAIQSLAYAGLKAETLVIDGRELTPLEIAREREMNPTAALLILPALGVVSLLQEWQRAGYEITEAAIFGASPLSSKYFIAAFLEKSTAI